MKSCKVAPRSLQLGTGLEKVFWHSVLGCIHRDNLCCQVLLYVASSISFFNMLKPSSLKVLLVPAESKGCCQLLHLGAAGFDYKELTRGVIFCVSELTQEAGCPGMRFVC